MPWQGGCRAPGRAEGLGRRGEPDTRPELTRPDPLGDLLVAVPAGELRGVDAAEEVAVRLDERDAGTEDQLARGGRRRVPAAGAAGQGVDLCGVEQAAAATGRAPAGELAPAHVRVHGLGLHPETSGRLPGGESRDVGGRPGIRVLRSGPVRRVMRHGAHRTHIHGSSMSDHPQPDFILIQSILTDIQSSMDSQINVQPTGGRGTCHDCHAPAPAHRPARRAPGPHAA